MRHRVTLQIHRDDHKYDALGLIFLNAIDRDKTLALLRTYLGPHAALRHVELDDAVLHVEAEVRDFPNESRNLVEMGRDLARRGRSKAAVDQFEEALRLSPLNAEALKALGRLYYRRRQRDAARRCLVRAREITPGDVEILRLLAELALHDDRRLEALAYLERVLVARPNDRRARTALARLQPAAAAEAQAPVPAGGPITGSGSSS
jgi:Flp pilus assembly protein TadD